MSASKSTPLAYRKAVTRTTLFALFIWFFVSFFCSILARDYLDAHFPTIGHAPFGFWMAQQGSILSFVCILCAYAFRMNRLDRLYGYTDQ
jgi:putative solute:sodium symporter small subunit